MKISTSEFKEKLAIIKQVITKSALPALECAILKDFKLSGFDLVTSISVNCDVECETLIPLKAIKLIESLKTEYMEISTQKNQLIIKSGKATSKFSVPDISTYPELPKLPDAEPKILSIKTLQQIASVSYCTSTDENRRIQQGVLVADELAACDGYRLAISKLSTDINTVIPKVAIKLLPLFDSAVNMFSDNSRLYLMGSGITVSTARLDGAFLDYKSIAATPKNKLKIKASELADKLKTAELFADDKLKTPLKLSITHNALILSCATSTEQYEDSIEIDSDFEMTIGVNVKYLSEAVKNMESDFEMCFGSETQPIILENENQKAVVMPVRLRS